MACPEMDVMRQQVCNRLRGSVNTWQWNLQARYGDPRVYEMQIQELNRRDAELAHDLSRRSSANHEETYDQRTQKAKAAHSKRISTAIKSERTTRRGRKSSSKLPESAAAQPRT